MIRDLVAECRNGRFEYDIRNPLVHVPLSLTDTCQLFLSITERRQKDHIEYIPDVESLRFWEILRPLRAGKEPFDLGYSGVPNGKGSIAPLK
jgi:hypothetical protein